jgi:hypothetical protein
MPLPAELLEAVSSPGGGRVAFVIGAGCSLEAPTGLPLSREVSREIHRLLIEDGILHTGDCANPDDLSEVTDAVFARTHSQRDVVNRFLHHYDLKLATPNHGYRIAAALLCEGVISTVVTLNFDLALTTALGELGGGGIVGIVERPEDLPHQRVMNVYYLHRNANAADPELWVLRTESLTTEWIDHWEEIIATSVLAAPVVVFAGLGTPVAVLLESTRLLRNALPGTTNLFQADPGAREDSRFSAELQIGAAGYIQHGWGELMELISQRVSVEQVAQIRTDVTRKVNEDGLQNEDLTALLERMRALGIVKLGKLRARWLLHDKPYCPVGADASPVLADFLLALAMIVRISGTTAVIAEDGIVELQREGRVVGVYLVASGRGHRTRAGIEARIEPYRFELRGRAAPPRGVLIGGTSDGWMTRPTPPRDIVQGDERDADLVTGPTTLPCIHIGELRANQNLIPELVS